MNKNHYLIILLICIIMYNVFSKQIHAIEGLRNLKSKYATEMNTIEDANMTKYNDDNAIATNEHEVNMNAYVSDPLLDDALYEVSDSKMTYSSPDSINYKYADTVVLDEDVRNYSTDYNAVEYHDEIEVDMNSVFVFDTTKGKMVKIDYNSVQNLVTYDPPGTYKYGLSSYVPTYTDSVLLSLLSSH